MKKMGECCNLAQLKVGQRGKILKLEEKDRKIRRHLLDMGMTIGTEVKVKKIAPLGDPIDLSMITWLVDKIKGNKYQVL